MDIYRQHLYRQSNDRTLETARSSCASGRPFFPDVFRTDSHAAAIPRNGLVYLRPVSEAHRFRHPDARRILHDRPRRLPPAPVGPPADTLSQLIPPEYGLST